MDGILVIDKPAGPTSHDVVARARRALGEPRIGHTGTLDPAASGVLPLVMGKATRLARFLSAGDKSYDAIVRLGFATDTGDAQGAMVGSAWVGALPTRDAIEVALSSFRGRFLQQPPVYSAKKIDGQRSYRLARAAARRMQIASAGTGGTPPGGAHAGPADGGAAPIRQPEPVDVTVYSLVILDVDGDRVALRVECSSGFYVRALAHDLGERLRTGAHLVGLRRTRCGDYGLAGAVPIDAIERDRDVTAGGFVPLALMLPQLSFVVLTSEGTVRVRNGRELGPTDLAPSPPAGGDARMVTSNPTNGPDRWIRLFTPERELAGLAQPIAGSGLLHPSVVLI
jgi:tRNA pseudouridine55 synthase